ncbi:MAG TPA: glycosyltransferase family 87 protein [Bryobacteraceae bacterium]|nr:glycosyltransferase family 87 protein [Bryobacteraceae bacterium]
MSQISTHGTGSKSAASGAQEAELRTLIRIAWAVGIVLFVAYAWRVRDRVLYGTNDFPTFYAGAKLAGTAALYDEAANYALQGQSFGAVVRDVYFTRPAFYALLLKPLGWLPYLGAYWVWQAVNVLALIWFLALFSARFRALVAIAALSGPLYSMLVNGQDVALILLFLGSSLLCLRNGRPFAAGLLLSLCAIKPHLVFALPLVLVVRREWRALAGLALGGAVLTAMSFAAGGVHWLSDYAALLSHPGLHQHGSYGLRTAVEGLGLSGLKWALATAGVCAMPALWIAWRSEATDLALAYAIPFSLLGGFHVYMHDLALLLVTCAIAAAYQKRVIQIASAASVGGPLGFLTPPWSLLPLAAVAGTAFWQAQRAIRLDQPEGRIRVTSD